MSNAPPTVKLKRAHVRFPFDDEVLFDDLGDIGSELAGMTLGEIVTDICHDLGITPDSPHWPTELIESKQIIWPT